MFSCLLCLIGFSLGSFLNTSSSATLACTSSNVIRFSARKSLTLVDPSSYFLNFTKYTSALSLSVIIVEASIPSALVTLATDTASCEKWAVSLSKCCVAIFPIAATSLVNVSGSISFMLDKPILLSVALPIEFDRDFWNMPLSLANSLSSFVTAVESILNILAMSSSLLKLVSSIGALYAINSSIANSSANNTFSLMTSLPYSSNVYSSALAGSSCMIVVYSFLPLGVDLSNLSTAITFLGCSIFARDSLNGFKYAATASPICATGTELSMLAVPTSTILFISSSWVVTKSPRFSLATSPLFRRDVVPCFVPSASVYTYATGMSLDTELASISLTTEFSLSFSNAAADSMSPSAIYLEYFSINSEYLSDSSSAIFNCASASSLYTSSKALYAFSASVSPNASIPFAVSLL